jgi:hypothetical protein
VGRTAEAFRNARERRESFVEEEWTLDAQPNLRRGRRPSTSAGVNFRDRTLLVEQAVADARG